jgi:hypothetical protein
MSIDMRTRSTSDGEDRRRRNYGTSATLASRASRYPTSGANALRVAPDVLDDEDILESGRMSTVEAPARKEAPRAVPRPRRRTPWVTDVTPAARDEETERAPDAPALPVALPKTPFLLLLVGLVVVGVVGVLVLNTKINESSFRLDSLRSTQGALDLQEQQLQQQLDELSSPGNLRAAATRLGLVPAGTPAFISLPDGHVVGVPQPAGE